MKVNAWLREIDLWQIVYQNPKSRKDITKYCMPCMLIRHLQPKRRVNSLTLTIVYFIDLCFNFQYHFRNFELHTSYLLSTLSNLHQWQADDANYILIHALDLFIVWQYNIHDA